MSDTPKWPRVISSTNRRRADKPPPRTSDDGGLDGDESPVSLRLVPKPPSPRFEKLVADGCSRDTNNAGADASTYEWLGELAPEEVSKVLSGLVDIAAAGVASGDGTLVAAYLAAWDDAFRRAGDPATPPRPTLRLVKSPARRR